VTRRVEGAPELVGGRDVKNTKMGNNQMNKKVSVAVGAAAAVAFTGVAFASDTVTINESEAYHGAVAWSNFMPSDFLLGDCTADLKGTTGHCNMHGHEMPIMAADGTFWTGGVAIPSASFSEAGGYEMQVEGAFDNGLFRSDGTSYWTGLSFGWNTIGDAIAEAGVPQGAPTFENGLGHDFWFDQVTVGYVQTNLDTDGNPMNGGEGAVTLAQNMRSSTRFAPGTDLENVENLIDQRLEQMVELSLGSNFPSGGTEGGAASPLAFEAARQTIQMAFGVVSGPNATTDPTVGENLDDPLWGELVSQDVEGFFFSCINCDTPALISSGVDHAFTPADLDARYMDYQSGWNVVPTVIHTGN
jgi:hypothetical protein